VDIQQLAIKVFARPGSFDQGALIPIFHNWIRERRLGDVVLIDVADYRHVPEGPGVMLIADEAHWAITARSRSSLVRSRGSPMPAQ
jgi:hypothetical protein